MSKYSSLTRYLYWKDEVEFSLILALLESNDLDEVLYWLYELYYSGWQEETFKLVFKIYYDFYAHLNPKLDDFISKNYEKWKKTKDDMIIGYIFRNLFGKQYTFKVFNLRQLMNSCLPSVIYKGRKPKWLEDYPKFMKNFLLAIKKKNYQNMCYYLSLFKDEDLKEVYLSVVKYYNKERKIEIKMSIIENVIDEFINGPYANTKHYILSIIMYLEEQSENLNLRKIFIMLTDDQIKQIKDINEKKIDPSYKTLRFKRKYMINPEIGAFNLKREIFENIEKEMWFHWEYNASYSPLWNKRMSEFKYSRNHEKREIEFENDDIMEDFYQKYGFLEPDEQPKDIQDASTGALQYTNWKALYKYLDCPEIVSVLDDDFRYVY